MSVAAGCSTRFAFNYFFCCSRRIQKRKQFLFIFCCSVLGLRDCAYVRDERSLSYSSPETKRETGQACPGSTSPGATLYLIFEWSVFEHWGFITLMADCQGVVFGWYLTPMCG